MLNTQQILNKVFRNEQGEPSAEILQLQQIFNHIFDESKNALRISSVGLLKTGQITKYHNGDDGDLKLGIAHDYTVLSTGQYASTTNITINGKTHPLSNNCVKDNKTGKMWARYVPNANIGPDNNGKLFWIDAANGEDIWAFIQQANANSLGGYNDWRIPNYHELLSIVNLSNCNPVIDTVAFPSTPSDYHWTSSTNPCNSAHAFYVHFYNGDVNNNVKSTSKFYVRLVRG